MTRRMLLLPVIVLLFSYHLPGQSTPFNRGVNLTGWFQTASARQIQFSRYTKKDFEQIRSLGCDVIRLPINLHFMTSGAPAYRIDPLFFSFLDQVIDWAEDLKLHLILDNHTFDPAANTDPGIGDILETVWRQMAERYRDRSAFLYYEILNEPHGIDDQLWNAIQQRIVTAIRKVDTTHTIIVGPAGWNSYHNLAAMPVYEDDNLIFTFHFYDPFLFTHQGASWTDPSMQPLAGIPFPYRANAMPALPASLRGTWIENAFNSYQDQGTPASVKALVDIAVRFREERGVPLFCGEFGVYIPNSADADRVLWYETIRRYLEEKDIAWTSWDYHGGFGLFKAGGSGLFDHDLNIPLLEALGLNTPPQTPYQKIPDTTGSQIYFDFIGPGIFEASYGNALIDYYAPDQPNNGEFCLKWAKPDQYNVIGFDFGPDRDLSQLMNEGYALDFLVRGDTPGASFDVRFVDTKTNTPGDRPWRIRMTIDDRQQPWDQRWRHFYLPLRNFTEQGAWDDGWFPPQGKFDWKAIDRLEIVAEYGGLEAASFWFDNIQLTNQDTARIYVTTSFPDETTASGKPAPAPLLKGFPNPSSGRLFIETGHSSPLNCHLYDSFGRRLQTFRIMQHQEIDLSGLSPGCYYLYPEYPRGSAPPLKIVKN